LPKESGSFSFVAKVSLFAMQMSLVMVWIGSVKTGQVESGRRGSKTQLALPERASHMSNRSFKESYIKIAGSKCSPQNRRRTVFRKTKHFELVNLPR
jgi:hypothetical protein